MQVLLTQRTLTSPSPGGCLLQVRDARRQRDAADTLEELLHMCRERKKNRWPNTPPSFCTNVWSLIFSRLDTLF